MHFKSVYEYDVEISSLIEAVEEVKSTLDGLKAIRYTKGLTGEGPVSTDNGLTSKIKWIMDQEEKISNLINARINLMEKIEKLPSPTWRAICRYRLVKGYTYERIAEEMQCSRMDVYRKFKRAVKELKKAE
ncbi:hypothetical protein IX317_000625 [Fusobacterium sp. DD29]|uniref:RNA polymerase sigma factor n=1 Tax=unclassified Fusobacterium TaxID=2648384 RepID=UPI001B8C9915|nr:MULTISPECIES: sigma factor-like helix-turn-helix DNA-binding protein [unclassified Fusobacterium]MBR8700253.1 hypothetical protein [Fusobacterium sp. DD45]MBR8710492.1 hypothetical protein [Fusobacterium sp. DD28]MBR8748964.1 hypothetical protein [Fusobacterium sp. DD29]MBR8751058.1 hypothetical protein [Fusobacterium sp. DD26]MBR8761270.1 hypothetical protein [Fusobacterium sp. DD25]